MKPITNRFGRRAGLAIGQPSGQFVVTRSYLSAGYDGASQLVQAWAYRSDGTPLTSQKWSYGYDPAQNLSKRTNHTTVETFSVNALNQLTGVPDSTPSYDRRGNLVTRAFSGNQTWTYAYDHENRLTSVATDTYYTPEAYRFKVELLYDGAARLRIKRNYTWSGGGWYGSGGETRYVYDGLLLVQERDGNGTPLVTYTRGRDLSGSLEGAGGIGGLLARSHGYSSGAWSSHTFYHADGNGNVTALVNSGGTLQASYLYDPYGRYLAGTGTLAVTNAMRFSSKPWVAFAGSATSGLYYYGYRFYEPYVQRWLNRDPIEESGGINLYGFVSNRPSSATDIDGRLSPAGWAGWGAAGGAVVALAWYVLTCQTACDRVMDGALASARAEANLIAAGDSQHSDEGSRADALTHCIAACRLAREPMSCRTAARALDRLQARERGTEAANLMDRANNIAGYSVGTAVKGGTVTDCGRDCTTQLNAGGLFTFQGNRVTPFPPHEYFPVPK